MPIALIAAAAGDKLVIGKNGDLPWHFSSDLKFFKATTLNHPVLMGRVTYQSILKRLNKPLPGRKNIVLTRDKNFTDDRVTIIHDIKEIATGKDETLFIIGGAEIYKQTIGIADTIYMTHIDQNIEGDAYFPPLDKKKWKLVSENKTTENEVGLRFCRYERIA
ncbi:MAG: dihydrofolate reductase [Alphaproteobacteria bacterium]